MKKMSMPSLPILLVDDEAPWLRSLTITLKSAGFTNLLQCQKSTEVMTILAGQQVSLILLDLMMPHLSGEELLSMITLDHPQVPVIMLSGLNQLETAVKCMKMGAFDYFVKTTEKERLIVAIQRVLSFECLQRENSRLKEQVLDDQIKDPNVFSEILTVSRKMRAVFRYVEAVAPSSEPILITGESGVGKELVAQAVHRISRGERPWVAVNVGGLDDLVFADTLFGHCKGAFTGAERVRSGLIEKAGDGTLFLDEIGDLSPASQVKLLRLLQEGEYFPLGSDVPKKSLARIVCATHHDLEERMATGGFRKDLYFRLRTHHVHIPPLRERRADIPHLLDHFLAAAAQVQGKVKPAVSDRVLSLLSSCDFPGNIRELRALAYDAVSLSRRGHIPEEVFGKAVRTANTWVQPAAEEEIVLPIAVSPDPDRLPTLEEAGLLLVSEAMRRANNNRTIAAKWLGLTRQGLSKRLKKLGC